MADEKLVNSADATSGAKSSTNGRSANPENPDNSPEKAAEKSQKVAAEAEPDKALPRAKRSGRRRSAEESEALNNDDDQDDDEYVYMDSATNGRNIEPDDNGPLELPAQFEGDPLADTPEQMRP